MAALFAGLSEASGFVLAGGAALIARGEIDRLTRDLDFFATDAFDLAGRRARPVVAELLRVFRGVDRPLAPIEIASWAQVPQAELDDVAPADWVADGRPDEAVVTSARRSAARLAA